MPIQFPPAQSPSPRRPLVTLRTTVILMIALLVTTGVGIATVTTGLGVVEIVMSIGTAFAGSTAFLNKVIE